MIAFVFPGQGSQKRGMGAGLFDEARQYAEVEKEVDAILGYSLRELCLEDPDNRLKETEFTQPCLYVVNALHYYKAVNQGARPDYLAGHSLGEYNALLAAGVFDFLTGLRLAQRRGELMSRAKNGGMAAVIGLGSGGGVDRRKPTGGYRYRQLQYAVANGCVGSDRGYQARGALLRKCRRKSIYASAGQRRLSFAVYGGSRESVR
jgi:malonyl CoA-acyl carrier protein transacylase